MAETTNYFQPFAEGLFELAEGKGILTDYCLRLSPYAAACLSLPGIRCDPALPMWVVAVIPVFLCGMRL